MFGDKKTTTTKRTRNLYRVKIDNYSGQVRCDYKNIIYVKFPRAERVTNRRRTPLESLRFPVPHKRSKGRRWKEERPPDVEDGGGVVGRHTSSSLVPRFER